MNPYADIALHHIVALLDDLPTEALPPDIRHRLDAIRHIACAPIHDNVDTNADRSQQYGLSHWLEQQTASGMWEYDPTTDNLWMSSGSRELFNLGAHDQLTAAQLADCFADGGSEWITYLRRCASGEGSKETILNAVRGADIWKCRVYGTARPNAAGNITHVEGLFADVTELEKTRSEHNLLFQTMIHGVALHELICDEDGHPIDYLFEAVNPAFERLTGLRAEDIIGRTVMQILPGTEPLWVETYGRVTLTGEPMTFESFSSELGRWYEVTAFRHRPMGFACIISDITSRRHMQQALQANEERLRLTLEATQDGIWDWDVPTGQAVFSARYYTMLGYPPDAFTASYESWKQLLHPDDLSRTEQHIQTHMSAPDGFTVEFRMRTADGNWKWILGRGRSVAFGPRGEPLRMVGTHTDITDRKLAEQALRDSEARFRALADLTIEGIVIHNQGVAIDLNRSIEHILAAPRHDLIGQNLLKLVHPDDLPTVMHHMRHRFARPYSVRMYRRTGEMFWAEIESCDIEIDGHPCRVSALRDVTERRQAEQTLEAERHRLQFVIEAASLGAWEWDLQTNRTVFNQTWATMIGYTLEELAPYDYTTWERLVHPEDITKARQALTQCIDGISDHYESVFRMRHKAGHWIWILDRGRVMQRDAQGRPLVMYGTHTDITKQKETEEAMAAQLQELKRWQTTLLNRSDRSQALKREVNDLLARLGMPPKYTSVVHPHSQRSDMANGG